MYIPAFLRAVSTAILFIVSNLILNAAAGKEFYFSFPLNDEKIGNGYTSHLMAAIINVSEYDCHIRVEFSHPWLPAQEISLRKGDSAVLEFPAFMEGEQYNQPEQKGIYINADQDIYVFAFSHDTLSSDAFTVLPIHRLGQDYMASTLPCTIWGRSDNPENRFSGIMLLATQDSTVISISIPGTMNKKNILLDRMQTMMLRAKDITEGLKDISGCLIESNNKIACISFHERTAAPRTSLSGTRNFIAEMNFPISVAGTQYILTPHFSIHYGRPTIARITGLMDSSIIHLHQGDLLLRKGQTIMFEYSIPMLIYSDKPFLCSQIEPSAGISRTPGDPMMIDIPPISRFYKKSAAFIFPIKDFTEHYVHIIMKERSAFYINQERLADSIFIPVPGCNYVYGIYKLPRSGVQLRMQSDTDFCCLIYGYGAANAYGYHSGDYTLPSADTNPPVIAAISYCNTAYIQFNSKILNEKTEILPANISIKQEAPGFLVTSLQFDDSDGFIHISARNSLGKNRDTLLFIKGFTILCTPLELVVTDFMQKGLSTLSQTFINYGRFTQKFQYSLSRNIDISLPVGKNEIILEPGNSCTIALIAAYKAGVTLKDTLRLIDDCQRIRHIPLHYQAEPDSYAFGCSLPVQIQSLNLALYSLYSISGQLLSQSYEFPADQIPLIQSGFLQIRYDNSPKPFAFIILQGNLFELSSKTMPYDQ
jgi:hypothetical protein